MRKKRRPYERNVSDACRAAAEVLRHWSEDGLQTRKKTKKVRTHPLPAGPARSEAAASVPGPAPMAPVSYDRVSDLHEDRSEFAQGSAHR